MDDIVITTMEENTLLDDLRETFANLKHFHIKLNPKKCTFGVPAGQLLGYLVSARGIEVRHRENKGHLDNAKAFKAP